MSTVQRTISGLVLLASITAIVIWRDRIFPKGGSAHGGATSPNAHDSTSATATSPASDGRSAGTTLKKLLEGGDLPKLTAGQLHAFVERQKHSAASLLAAWQLGGDAARLDEAAQRYPDDPRVALAKLGTMSEMNAESKEWIERLKKSDPGNATGWCYEALSAFREGSPEAARSAIEEAAKLGRFDAFTKDSAAGLTEAYRSAGYEGLAAEMLGLAGVMLPQAQLAMNLQKEAISQLGGNLDDDLVQDMLKLAKTIRGADEGSFLITRLVGSAMERRMLGELNTLDLVPGTKKFVLERLDELDAEKNLVRTLVQKTGPLMSTLSDSELKQYFKRSSVEGELKAMQWLLGRHPEAK